ncbi:MAG: S1 family peptidase [Nocardioides sp.]
MIDSHTALWESGQLTELSTEYDRKLGRMAAVAQPPEKLTKAEGERLVHRTVAGLPPRLQDIGLVLDNDFKTGTDARRGGGRLEEPGSGSLLCTAGFNVVDSSSGVTGVATAGHCPNSLTHENANGDAEWETNHQQQHRGAWGDFQWATTADTEPARFIPDNFVLRDVTGLASPITNQILCRFGHTTDLECSRTAALSDCYTVDGISYCRMVRMEDDEASGGDSGGPWYSGSTAYGFHSGYKSCGASTCDVWARVTYRDEAWGVVVRTQ